MTDRIPLDHLTSDALDALYEQLERAQRIAMHVLDADAPDQPTPSRRTTLRDEIAAAIFECPAGYPDDIADAVMPVLDRAWPWLRAEAEDAAHDPAATQATEPHTGLVIQPYRNDQGQDAWVFRCWGTDTCDGWLSLDHSSQQSAERARDRHVAEEHAEPGPADGVPS